MSAHGMVVNGKGVMRKRGLLVPQRCFRFRTARIGGKVEASHPNAGLAVGHEQGVGGTRVGLANLCR